MTLKAQLLEELQKLRLSRERPIGAKTTKQKQKDTDVSDALLEAKRLLEELK